MSWLDAVSIEEIPARGARVLHTAGETIALFRTSDDRVYALRDHCPHRGGPLSQGIVHGSCVTCPLHEWVIDLASGAATGPDEGATRVFAVRVEGDRVLVELPGEACGARGSETASDTDASAAASIAAAG